MDLINAPLDSQHHGVLEVLLPVDRHTLAKRRWHGMAEDGRQFGFDLAEPLHDTVPFFHADGTTYYISQQPEPVVEIAISSPSDGARLGWLVGNLHFALEIAGSVVIAVDDPAVRQMLEREHISYSASRRVFHPMRQAHVH